MEGELMPASMDSPSPNRLRSDSEAESADKVTFGFVLFLGWVNGNECP